MDGVTVLRADAVVDLAAEVVAAYVSRNHVRATELPRLIAAVHDALAGLGSEAPTQAVAVERPMPAQVRHSVTHEALVRFEDGRRYKTLKRHLTACGLTPERYRAKWGLPADYPMVSRSYSEQRSRVARDIGLGRPSSPRGNRAGHGAP